MSKAKAWTASSQAEGAVLFWGETPIGRPAADTLVRLARSGEALGFVRQGRGWRLPECDRTFLEAFFEGPVRALFPERTPTGEKLPLYAPDRPAVLLALVDRSLFRPFGLATTCVRLWIEEETPEGPVYRWGQRSERKRIGPGLWDSPAAGLLRGEESVRDALLRETAEETGLDLTEEILTAGPVYTLERDVAEGVLRETTHNFVWRPTEPPLLRLIDGEVARFAGFRRSDIERLHAEHRLFADAALGFFRTFSA